ncbi:VanZ family protein [Pediococcus pentosaceus]|uniref:VanZ family protein n=1 Tax=Pediococcus pentosaceus TaxID=1255 RepID=UPI003D808697
MFVIKYLPFFGLSLLIVIGCLVAFERGPSVKRAIVYGSLAIYLVCVAWLLFTPGHYFIDLYYYNRYFYWHHAKIIYIPSALHSMGSFMNIVMTIPAGVYLGILFHKHLNWFLVVIAAGMTGLFNEGMQLVLDVLINIQRTVDITDVITNACGVIAGYILFSAFDYLLKLNR